MALFRIASGLNRPSDIDGVWVGVISTNTICKGWSGNPGTATVTSIYESFAPPRTGLVHIVMLYTVCTFLKRRVVGGAS